jgi:branched-chain amino acid aminotransferase
MAAVVHVNGKILTEEHATVSVFDHGFLFGEGIYETLRTYRRVPFLLDRHLVRLRHSADLMALRMPFSDAELTDRVQQTMGAHPALDEAYIRILITRGVGDLSYNLAATPTPSLVIIVKPFVPHPEKTFTEGISVVVARIRRNHPDALNPMIKSNNLMNNALAMQDAIARGGQEALMLNHAGQLAECSQSNIFLVRDGAVLTPPLSAGLLPGITREYVLELAAELNVPAREVPLGLGDLAAADEVFLTGTTREVTPVTTIDGRPVRDGKPGRLTRQLLAAFRQKACGSPG